MFQMYTNVAFWPVYVVNKKEYGPLQQDFINPEEEKERIQKKIRLLSQLLYHCLSLSHFLISFQGKPEDFP